MQAVQGRSPSPERDLNEPFYGNVALWGGIIFAALFTGLIALLDYRFDSLELTFLPDQGAAWYFWQLPNATLITQTSAWLLYTLHQLSFWGLIYYAQTRIGTYSKGLHPINLLALGMNALFIGLHFVQTHLFYDGLAQDVSISSSQYSVILMLVLILMMENQRRGLFFGKKVPLAQNVTGWLRRYHGYIFAWAVTYTFWYHPMVSTQGHLIGFFYMFLLMLQGSLFLTRIHLNRYWTFTQEILVMAHGTLVALQQGTGIWPIFFFGFMGIFVITQVYGLGLPKWIRYGSFILWVVGALAIINSRGSWKYIFPITGIPMIEYLLVFVFTLLLWGGAWVIQRARPAGV